MNSYKVKDADWVLKATSCTDSPSGFISRAGYVPKSIRMYPHTQGLLKDCF